MDGDVRLVIAVGPAIQRAAGAVPFRVRGECRIAVAGLIEDPAGQLRRPPDHTAGLQGDGIQGHRRAALLARCEDLPRERKAVDVVGALRNSAGVFVGHGGAEADVAPVGPVAVGPAEHSSVVPIFQLILGRADPAVTEVGAAVVERQALHHAVHRQQSVRALSGRSLEGRPDPVEPAGQLSGNFTERRDAVLDGRLEPHRAEGSGQHGGIRHIHHGDLVY